MTNEKPTNNGSDNDDTRKRVRQVVDDFGPTFAMIMIIGLVILVVVFILAPRDPDIIVIQSAGTAADFNATSALAYADRISRVAEISVGAILTLAIGLVGFSWVSNNARLERDRQELAEHKRDLDSQLTKRLAEQSQVVATGFEGIRTQIEGVRNDLRSYTDSKFLDAKSSTQVDRTARFPPSPREIRSFLERGEYESAIVALDLLFKDAARIAEYRQSPQFLRRSSTIAPAGFGGTSIDWHRQDPVTRRLNVPLLEHVLFSLPNMPVEMVQTASSSIGESIDQVLGYIEKLPINGQQMLQLDVVANTRNSGDHLVAFLKQIRQIFSNIETDEDNDTSTD